MDMSKVYQTCVVIFIEVLLCMCRPNTSCKFLSSKHYSCDSVVVDIPEGISSMEVEILDWHVNLQQKGTILGKNWKSVRNLTLINIRHLPALFKLSKLEELHIHSEHFKHLEGLKYLSNLRILDLKGCIRLFIAEVLNVLQSGDMLPQLKTLSLSGVGLYYLDEIAIDKNFSQAIGSRGLSMLDLSNTTISKIDFLKFMKNKILCKTLTHIDISYADIQSVSNLLHGCNLKLFNVSYAKFHSTHLIDMLWNNKDLEIREFSRAETCDVSGVFDKSTPLSAIPRSVYLCAKNHLIARDNYFVHLDVSVPCFSYRLDTLHSFPTMRVLDLARNDIAYIHQNFISCIRTVSSIDLSFNRLDKMAFENITAFELVFSELSDLQNLKLSSNKLTFIPPDMFKNNKQITEIDLSGNKLNQITFKVDHLQWLKALNLKGNVLKIIQTAEMSNLGALFVLRQSGGPQEQVGYNLQVDLSFNPILCMDCKEYDSIKWLHQFHHFFPSSLTCESRNGPIAISNKAVQDIYELCEAHNDDIAIEKEMLQELHVISETQNGPSTCTTKKKDDDVCETQNDKTCVVVYERLVEEKNERCEIRSGVEDTNSRFEMRKTQNSKDIEDMFGTSAYSPWSQINLNGFTYVCLGLFILAIVLVCIIKHCLNKKEKCNLHIEQQKNRIRQGIGEFEFMVFVSVCCDDAEFVKKYVLEDLQKSLSELTECDRDMICVGDKNFLPGQLIKNEIDHYLQKCLCLIFVVSAAACDSEYCLYELEQAKDLSKPILLMIKDYIDPNRMSPLLLKLFHNNVRILWDRLGDEYVLKTTWSNIAQSVFKLINNR